MDRRDFDVAIIGAGAVGIGAVEALIKSGYSVVLIDRGDFASGTSSRSSRVMNCGLQYLAPNNSTMGQMLKQPRVLATGLRQARAFMRARSGFVREFPDRSRTATSCYPIWRGDRYAGWQVDLAFAALRMVDVGGAPLNYRRVPADRAKKIPLVKWLRDAEKLHAVATYTEVLMDWPERVLVDSVLSSEARGATVLNHTIIEAVTPQGDGSWTLRVRRDETVDELHARLLVNAAGPWIDEVLARTPVTAPRKIAASKGTHIMVRLPPECAQFGIVTLNRKGQPYTILPLRGLHCLGPTWDPYSGGPDDAVPLESEIAALLDEARYILPGLSLARQDVAFAWSGLRPYAFHPDFPQGKRGLEFHDMAEAGLPNMLAVTGSPLGTYRVTGAAVAAQVATRLAPSSRGTAAQSAPLEHARTLVDLLFRRTGEGWDERLGLDVAEAAARRAALTLGWDEAGIQAEFAAYRAHVARQHLVGA